MTFKFKLSNISKYLLSFQYINIPFLKYKMQNSVNKKKVKRPRELEYMKSHKIPYIYHECSSLLFITILKKFKNYTKIHINISLILLHNTLNMIFFFFYLNLLVGIHAKQTNKYEQNLSYGNS